MQKIGIEKGVGDFNNGFHGSNNSFPKMNGTGIYEYDKHTKLMTLKGFITIDNVVENTVGLISLKVNDIVVGNNHDFLIFSNSFSFDKIGSANNGEETLDPIMKALNQRELWYLKIKTGLSEQEELFLRSYNSFSHLKKQQFSEHHDFLMSVVRENVLKFQESVTTALNQKIGIGGEIELF